MRIKNKLFVFMVLMSICLFPVFAQGVTDTQNLVADVESDDIYTLLRVCHFLDQRIARINSDFDNLLIEENEKIEQQYLTSIESILNLEPELWETDAAFQARIKGLTETLRDEVSTALTAAKESSEANRLGPTSIFEEKLHQVTQSIRRTRVIEDECLSMELQEYQRNDRKWPIVIESAHPDNNFSGLEAIVDFYEYGDEEEELRQQIVDFAKAIESNALTIAVEWTIERDTLHDRFVFVVKSVSVENTINDLTYHTVYPDGILTKAYVVLGDMYDGSTIKPISVMTDAHISRERFSPDLPATLHLDVFPKNIIQPTLSLYVEDPSLFEIRDYTIKALKAKGKTNLVLTDDKGLHIKTFPIEIAYAVGDEGPARGYIFYDAEDYSRGWRYLEAAPNGWSGKQEDPRHIFGYYKPNGSGKDVRAIFTDTSGGSGKNNTAMLIAAMGDKAYQYDFGSQKDFYAAKVASDCSFTVDGEVFDDWFLPSKDELDLLYRALLKNNSNPYLRDRYWSSSENGATEAWYQDLYGSGFTQTMNRYQTWKVRPVRSF